MLDNIDDRFEADPRGLERVRKALRQKQRYCSAPTYTPTPITPMVS